MTYNRISAWDIFANPMLGNVFPQFYWEDLNGKVSAFDLKQKVNEYLVSALGAEYVCDDEIIVKGTHSAVLSRVRCLQAILEAFYNNMRSFSKAVFNEAPMYMPYATVRQMYNLTDDEDILKAMQEALDNLQYNSDLGMLNCVKHEKPRAFERHKRAWEKRVGYRSLKKV